MAEFINFFGKKKDYRSFSNFWEGDIKIKGNRLYESGEHGYHGEKYFRLGNLCEDEERKQKMIEHSEGFLKPSIYKTCSEAKKMGGKRGFGLTGDEQQHWFIIGLEMKKAKLLWKHKNYQEVRADLLKNKLEEVRRVVRDGELVILGKNMLGNIWMEIREVCHIRNNTKENIGLQVSSQNRCRY